MNSKMKRLQEVIITDLLGNLPAIALGPKLRKLIYKSIFKDMGKSVYIQNGVELLGAYNIEIGDGVHLFKGVRVDALGNENNKITIKEGVAIERNVDIGALDNTHIYIDKGTFIGVGASVAGPGNVKIGKRCLIAARCGIFANNHKYADPSRYIADQGVTCQGITIEDDCWLGHAVTVVDGVTIGKGSVIGAGAVVTKDIPPYSIAVGTPARVIKSRLPEDSINSKDLEIISANSV
ncbi:acetyltransferase (isoleucine patch superfamily) [Rivularia sp. PCC 7116]|uniref:acyltransferase n=1 Tax=Rivularia sp. PCC 7116 TaxID=373994 RepID=UPI00029EFD8B|nr:acyltransferase [Rivularia sp. PCC 7116]AFY54444.1 acetyltransferase (isoleucine patch superfamily) [Rivularia sp. PCC 7116]